MIAPKRRNMEQPADSPMPTLWSELNRGRRESALDSETAITLACHLGQLFDTADSWDALVTALAERGFGLRFEDTRLVLVNDATGTSLCTCASMGRSFASLAERLGKPRVQANTARLIVLAPEAE